MRELQRLVCERMAQHVADDTTPAPPGLRMFLDLREHSPAPPCAQTWIAPSIAPFTKLATDLLRRVRAPGHFFHDDVDDEAGAATRVQACVGELEGMPPARQGAHHAWLLAFGQSAAVRCLRDDGGLVRAHQRDGGDGCTEVRLARPAEPACRLMTDMQVGRGSLVFSTAKITFPLFLQFLYNSHNPNLMSLLTSQLLILV